jgi:hypothetical protein
VRKRKINISRPMQIYDDLAKGRNNRKPKV